jgi:hypothetical protein
MGYSAQEYVDAIVTAGALHGADGRGKDELDGYMFMLARTNCRRFGILLGGALQSKMTARRNTDDEKPDFLTLEEAQAELRKFGIPERVLDYLPSIDVRTVPADRRRKAQPTGTRVITEAVINAATAHGSDGRGKDGLLGYLLMLDRVDPPTFDVLTRMAQRWQVKHPPRSPKRELDPRPEESISAILKKLLEERCGPDRDHIGKNPYEDPEVDDEGLIDATANTRAAE